MTDDASITEEYEALRERYSELQDQANLTEVEEEVSELSATVGNLPAAIEQIRSRGYAFASYLEQKAKVLGEQWGEFRRDIERDLDSQRRRLLGEIRQVEEAVEKSDAFAHKPSFLKTTLAALEREIGDAETKIEATVNRLKSSYEALSGDIGQTDSQLTQINWYCDQKEEASFDFLAAEALFLAAQAEWVASGKGKGDPDGIIYLTDQRLIFEQKEKTGKKLGLFGGKHTQEVEWEIPLNMIESVKAENKGFFGGKDMLYFTLKSGAPYPQITVEVKGGVNCKFWKSQIERMISGGTKDERAIEPDPEVVEALKSAPTACEVCGGMLPQIVAGQREVLCKYCGMVIRI